MRPVSLRLQAFGSYGGELCVDFARLSSHGIFAISGPTGAGKSTIFDALVYALYDDLPGFRVDGNVRSQFAEPSTPTSVSLEFVVHGERWRVERKPTQRVRRLRGEGEPIEKKSTVVLGRVGDDGDLEPGTVSTRKEEVRRRIDALVGLTKDQFEQVVLIPQGRFEEVLKTDTSKRAPLLRRLFPVDVFTRVTESLKAIASRRQEAFEEAARAAESVTERMRDAYEGALELLPDDVRAAVFGPDGVPPMEVADLGRHVDRLVEAMAQVDVLVAARATQADKTRAQLDDARRAAADWDRWQADLALSTSFEDEENRDADEHAALERGRRLADLRTAICEWEGATRRLGLLEPELGALLEVIESAWPPELDAAQWTGAPMDSYEAGVLAERLAADARRLLGEVKRFERLVDSHRALGGRRATLEERRIELGERAVKLDAEERGVVLVAEEVQALRVEVSTLEALRVAVDGLEREHRLASGRVAAVAQLQRFDAELSEASDLADRAGLRAEVVRSSWREGLAGRLAQLLADGEPCPTCGALEHPNPAEWREGGADDEAVAAVELARDEAAAHRSDVERRAATARGVVGALAQTRPLDAVDADLAARRESLSAVRDAMNRLAVVAAEEARRRSALLEARERVGVGARSLDVDLAHLDADTSAHELAVQEFVRDHGALESPAPRAEARGELAADVAKLAGILRDVERAQEVLCHCSAVVEPVARELDATHPGQLFVWMVGADELGARTRALEARRSRRQDVRRRIAEYEARAGTDADVGASSRPDVDSMEAAAQAAAAQHVALLQRSALIADRVAVLAAGPTEVADAARAADAARLRLERARTVFDRCAGLGGGPTSLRLSLENWVLADYLRQVLVQANHRLDVMTDGRFALELTDGVTDGRKPFGLDLSVFDANTGQVRAATTLSGGETFMAALALALGLADVVSGGSNREVGALFVDEGFGSLDAQSLDAVIDVLRSLEDGGRMVGIVSHVRELQQALPTGITVEPSARGSVATVHYPLS